MISFIQAIQTRIAQVAIGASTVRGQGAKGVATKAREFLTAVDFSELAELDRTSFSGFLNAETTRLSHALPKEARSWGLARKCLNIFLRDAFYNVYLRDEYRLAKAEAWFELPLDGEVAKRLRQAAGKGVLPRWDTVKRLEPSTSAAYQGFASDYAAKLTAILGRNLARVHLDLYLWRQD